MDIYTQAVFSQTACNLSGLIHSLPKIADQVWEEVKAEHGFMNTSAFNGHPVMRLFAEQIMHLTNMQIDYSTAAGICDKKAAEAARKE